MKTHIFTSLFHFSRLKTHTTIPIGNNTQGQALEAHSHHTFSPKVFNFYVRVRILVTQMHAHALLQHILKVKMFKNSNVEFINIWFN